MSAFCSAPVANKKPGRVGTQLVAWLIFERENSTRYSLCMVEKRLIFKGKPMSRRGMQIA
jgi:hypothetical protein